MNTFPEKIYIIRPNIDVQSAESHISLGLMNGFLENGAGKIVYVAPNKALCDEKYGEWTQKFEAPFGLRAEILTGGTLSLELASVRTFATRCCKTHDGIARLPVQIPSDEDLTKKSHARGSF